MRFSILFSLFALVFISPAAHAQVGDNCDLAGFILHDLSVSDAVVSGSTAFQTNDYTYGSACGGYNASSGAGADVVYKLETPNNCTMTVTLDSTQLPVAYDTALWVVTDCSDPVAGCVGGADDYPSGESVTFAATAGTVYYVIVDAYGTTNDGTYELTVSGPGCNQLLPVTLQSLTVE